MSATDREADNPFRGLVDVIVSPQLDAASATAFYVVAGPSYPIVEVDFLGGVRGPQLARYEGRGVLGTEWISFIDIGTGAVDYHGGILNAGA